MSPAADSADRRGDGAPQSDVDAPAGPARNSGDGPAVTDRAARLHRDAVVVDLHADTPTEFFRDPAYDFADRHEAGHIDLARMREGGLDVEIFIAWVPEELAERPGASGAHALDLIHAIREVLGRTPGVQLATRSDEVDAALGAGDVVGLIGIEGGHALENSIERLREFHALGLRYLTLTWNNTHDWADACCSPARHGGLTGFGREVVRELDRLGILVDVSHAAEATFRHVLEEASGPVIASHSCARALVDHPRNLADEQLRAIAATGGVVGVNFFPAFLDPGFCRSYYAIEAEAAARERHAVEDGEDPGTARDRARAWRLEEWRRIPPVAFDALIEHILHIAAVAGIDHVALGSDFDGVVVLPRGIRDAADLPRVTQALLDRGLSDDEVRKILGGNALRVFRQTLR